MLYTIAVHTSLGVFEGKPFEATEQQISQMKENLRYAGDMFLDNLISKDGPSFAFIPEAALKHSIIVVEQLTEKRIAERERLLNA